MELQNELPHGEFGQANPDLRLGIRIAGNVAAREPRTESQDLHHESERRRRTKRRKAACQRSAGHVPKHGGRSAGRA